MLAWSGNSTDSDVHMYIEMGFRSVLRKPFTLEDMEALLERVTPASPPV